MHHSSVKNIPNGRTNRAILNMFNSRFTLADPITRLCPDAVGGESGSTHPMHTRITPGHHSQFHIGRRARALSADLHQESCSLMIPFPVYLRLASYMLCTILTDPVFHPHTPFPFSLFFFKFMKTSAPPANKNTCMPSNLAWPQQLSFLHRIVTILINGYSNAGHYNHKYDLQTTAEHENESRVSWQVTHFQIPYIFETSREIAIVTVIGRDCLPCIIPLCPAAEIKKLSVRYNF